MMKIKVKQIYEKEVNEGVSAKLLVGLDRLHKSTGDDFELYRRNNKLIIRRITK